jgi:hypothetical protein
VFGWSDVMLMGSLLGCRMDGDGVKKKVNLRFLMEELNFIFVLK